MISTPLTINGSAPVLGSFGKGIRGSVALNFGRSGGKHCDPGCSHHPDTADPDSLCYAYKLETRADRENLRRKLDRHDAADPEHIVTLARAELRPLYLRKAIPWLRISAFGPVPATPPEGLRALLAEAVDHGVPVHFPIESSDKARTYREYLSGVPITVRESVHTLREWKRTPGPVSFVAGTMKGHKPRERVALAKRIAGIRQRHTGRPCKVCPSVAAMHLRTGSDRAKCGACTLCDDPRVDIIYPAHR